jgi:hypothetical protein
VKRSKAADDLSQGAKAWDLNWLSLWPAIDAGIAHQPEFVGPANFHLSAKAHTCAWRAGD